MTGAGFGDGFVLPQWAQVLVSDVDADSLVDVVVEADLQAAFPHLRANDEFVAQLTASVRENLRALAAVASGRAQLCDVEFAQPRLLAALQARLGVPQTLLQLSYRVGFLTIWRNWSAGLKGAPERRAEPGCRGACPHRGCPPAIS